MLSLKNVDSNKVELNDGQDIFMDKIWLKIVEVFSTVFNKDQKTRFEEHEMHNLLKNIEIYLDKLIDFRKEYMKGDEKSQKLLAEIEKKIQDKDKSYFFNIYLRFLKFSNLILLTFYSFTEKKERKIKKKKIKFNKTKLN